MKQVPNAKHRRRIVEAMHDKRNVGRLQQNKVPVFIAVGKNSKVRKPRIVWVHASKNPFYSGNLEAFLKSRGLQPSKHGFYEYPTVKRKARYDKLKEKYPAAKGQQVTYFVDSLGRGHVYVNGRPRLTKREILRRKQMMEDAKPEKAKHWYAGPSADGTRMVWRKKNKASRKKASNATLARMRQNKKKQIEEERQRLIQEGKMKKITIQRRNKQGQPISPRYRYVAVVPKEGAPPNEYIEKEKAIYIKRKKAALAKKYRIPKNAPDFQDRVNMIYQAFKQSYTLKRDARGILRWYKKPEARKQPAGAQRRPRSRWPELEKQGKARRVVDDQGKFMYYKLIGSERRKAADVLMQKYRDVLKKRGMKDEDIKRHFDEYYDVKTTRQGRLAVQVKPNKRAAMKRRWARNARARARGRQQVPQSLPPPQKCKEVRTHGGKTYEVACSWRPKQ